MFYFDQRSTGTHCVDGVPAQMHKGAANRGSDGVSLAGFAEMPRVTLAWQAGFPDNNASRRLQNGANNQHSGGRQ